MLADRTPAGHPLERADELADRSMEKVELAIAIVAAAAAILLATVR
jgi:hypothetical protein